RPERAISAGSIPGDLVVSGLTAGRSFAGLGPGTRWAHGARSPLRHGSPGLPANVARPVPGSPNPGSAGHLAGPSAFGSVALSGAREGSRSWEFSTAGSR